MKAFIRGSNTIERPGILRGMIYDYYSMNWGFGNPNGWFTDDIKYEHSRVDFFIEK